MSSSNHNTIYTVAMQHHNLHTTLQGSKLDIKGMLIALLGTGWKIAGVTKRQGDICH